MSDGQINRKMGGSEMIERPTPETDAFFDNAIETKNKYPAYCAPFESFCQKLERERDEAREAFVIATDQMVIAQGKVRKANKERDEWRKCSEKLAAIIGAPNEMESLLWKTEDEINEAWSVFEKLKEDAK